HALLEHRLLPQDALQLVRHALAEILHAQRLVAAQAAAELLLPHVEWGEVERGLGHVASTPAPGCGVSAPPAPPAPPPGPGPRPPTPPPPPHPPPPPPPPPAAAAA